MPIALLTITLAVFAICTTEWGIAGLLPVLSSDLSVSIPAAGLLVTGYALGVAIGGPILAVLTPHVPRKTALLAIMVLFILGQVVCALAPSYEALLAARSLSPAATDCSSGSPRSLRQACSLPGRALRYP